MGLSSAASYCLAASRPAPALSFGSALPVGQLRRAILSAPEVWVTVLADGEHCTLVKVTKAAALRMIRGIRRVSRTVVADMVFGALVIG